MWVNVCGFFLDSFLHKNPEDTSEVPNGFLSDINPVSVDPKSTDFDSALLSK